jgi:hypothetical protein
MATITDFAFVSTGGILTTAVGQWVRLRSIALGTDYFSTAVTDAQGSWTITAPPDDYQLYTGPAATVPGTPTLVDPHYRIGYSAGDDAALKSVTAKSSSPNVPFNGGVAGSANGEVWVAPPNGSDDTTAIHTAFLAAQGIGGANTMGWVKFFPGTYNYKGNGEDFPRYFIKGAGTGATTIVIQAGKYMLTPSTAINCIVIEDFSTSGGGGLFRQTFTGASVNQAYVFRNLTLNDYTVAAIGSLASDLPYVFVENVQFNGTRDASIGLGLLGDMSGGHAFGCAFTRNRYGIKLGQAGLAFKIMACDFVRFDAYIATPRTDIWFLPWTSGTNAGNGVVIGPGNKFGNENLNGADFRILYADEDTATGADFLVRSHKATTASSSSTIAEHHISGNKFSGIASAPPAPIYSTVDDVRGLVVGPNVFDGTPPQYMVQFLNPNAGDRLTNTSTIIATGIDANQVQPSASNRPGFGRYVDPLNIFADDGDSIQAYPGAGDDPEIIQLINNAMSAWSVVGATITAGQTDSLGGTTAILVTDTGAGGGFIWQDTPTSSVLGMPLWYEIELKSGGGSPATTVELRMKENDGGTPWTFQRVLNVPSTWRRFRFSIVPRTATIPQVQLLIPTASKTVLAGRAEVYQGREPVPYGYQKRQQAPAFSATPTFNPRLGKIITPGAMTANVTAVNAPTNPVVGQEITIVFLQDGTGGRTVAGWNAAFKVSWSDTGNTLNKRSAITFGYDGAFWQQKGAQTPYV